MLSKLLLIFITEIILFFNFKYILTEELTGKEPKCIHKKTAMMARSLLSKWQTRAEMNTQALAGSLPVLFFVCLHGAFNGTNLNVAMAINALKLQV